MMAFGDMAGGQFVPPPILRILANPRFDPDIAYVFWQLSRRPLADWTLSQLALVGQLAPTEVEAGVPIEALQALYQFWGLDPQDIFNPSLAATGRRSRRPTAARPTSTSPSPPPSARSTSAS